MDTNVLRTGVAWLLALLVACGGPTAQQASEPTREPERTAGPPAVEPSRHPRFSGVVREVLRGGPYSYLRIADRSDERWVVTMSPPPSPSQRVEVESFGVRHDFYARRIDRRFAALEFGIVEPETHRP